MLVEWGGERGGERAAPKKLCIFSPLFSHRRDETASDIDPATLAVCYGTPWTRVFFFICRIGYC